MVRDGEMLRVASPGICRPPTLSPPPEPGGPALSAPRVPSCNPASFYGASTVSCTGHICYLSHRLGTTKNKDTSVRTSGRWKDANTFIDFCDSQ